MSRLVVCLLLTVLMGTIVACKSTKEKPTELAEAPAQPDVEQINPTPMQVEQLNQEARSEDQIQTVPSPKPNSDEDPCVHELKCPPLVAPVKCTAQEIGGSHRFEIDSAPNRCAGILKLARLICAAKKPIFLFDIQCLSKGE